MMTSHEVLSVYEAMAGITEQMVQAATDADWERLGALEQQCSDHVRRLQQSEAPLALAGAQRARKVEAIRKMLDDDRKIRDLTMPWMAKLSTLISSAGAGRRVARAYGGV